MHTWPFNMPEEGTTSASKNDRSTVSDYLLHTGIQLTVTISYIWTSSCPSLIFFFKRTPPKMLVVVLHTSAVRAYFGLWCTAVSVFRAATAVGPACQGLSPDGASPAMARAGRQLA
jgi:hypothetical protein